MYQYDPVIGPLFFKIFFVPYWGVAASIVIIILRLFLMLFFKMKLVPRLDYAVFGSLFISGILVTLSGLIYVLADFSANTGLGAAFGISFFVIGGFISSPAFLFLEKLRYNEKFLRLQQREDSGSDQKS